MLKFWRLKQAATGIRRKEKLEALWRSARPHIIQWQPTRNCHSAEWVGSGRKPAAPPNLLPPPTPPEDIYCLWWKWEHFQRAILLTFVETAKALPENESLIFFLLNIIRSVIALLKLWQPREHSASITAGNRVKNRYPPTRLGTKHIFFRMTNERFYSSWKRDSITNKILLNYT